MPIARAKAKVPEARFAMHTVHAFTKHYDVVVTIAVVRQPQPPGKRASD